MQDNPYPDDINGGPAAPPLTPTPVVGTEETTSPGFVERNLGYLVGAAVILAIIIASILLHY